MQSCLRISPLVSHLRFSVRSLVSPAFQCQEEWNHRLDYNARAQNVFGSIQKKMGEFFVQLDRKFTTELRGSALDVDIFANAAHSESELEQLEELLHKLRRTPHTVHTPGSTSHAAVRAMIGPGAQEEHLCHLVRMLEDRTNYGVFLDQYTSVLLLDKLLEERRLAQGARVASQLMIQEENWTISNALGNLACWRYCAARDSESWFNDEEKDPSAEEEDPEDIVRVRVKMGPPHYGMVPNNYMDDHFDLRDPEKILGKSLWYFNKSSEDSLSKSLTFLGLIMWGKVDTALQMKMDDMVEEIGQEVAKIVNNEKIAAIVNDAKKVSIDVDKELLKRSTDVLTQNESSLIGETKELYVKWNQERDERFNLEHERHERKKNIESITQIKEELSREEERLFFFKNKEKLDYELEEKVNNWKKTWPRRSWPGTKGYFHHPKWIKTPGREMKTPRWVKREEKRGPPK